MSETTEPDDLGTGPQSVPVPSEPVDEPSREPARPARRRRGAWLPLLLGLIGGILLTVVAGLLIGGPYALAHRNDLPLERYYGNAAVGIASRLHAPSGTPQGSSNARSADAGRYAYTGSCAVCHGTDGKGKGVFGAGTYPPATDLTNHDASAKSDAQLYWIIQNGLSFTGMPGFSKAYDSNGIWALVAYVRQLQAGQTSGITVPTATSDQLAQADPHGNQTQRGAAIYFAQGCADCHGPVGNAPGELALRGGGREAGEALRQGRAGMPVYGPDQISDAQLADLTAYLNTFGGARRGDTGAPVVALGHTAPAPS